MALPALPQHLYVPQQRQHSVSTSDLQRDMRVHDIPVLTTYLNALSQLIQLGVASTIMPTVTHSRLDPELHDAAQKDDLARVKALTSQASRATWHQILCEAADTGATKVMSYALERGAWVDDVLLHWILNSPDSEPGYRHLIDLGALDVNHYIDRCGSVLGMVSRSRRHSLAQYALEKGARPDDPVDAQLGRTPLACAAMSSDTGMLGLLLDHGAKLPGSGALILAAERGKVENAKFLLQRGADVNEIGILTDPKQSAAEAGTGMLQYLSSQREFRLMLSRAALHKAVRKGHTEMISLLLSSGADTSLRDVQGKTAADIARGKRMGEDMIERLEPKL